MEIKEKVSIAMEAMEGFIKVLNAETAFLSSNAGRDNKDLRKLIGQKVESCSFYEQTLSSLLSETEEINKLPSEIKKALIDMQFMVNEATRENALRVKASLDVAEKITEIYKKCILDETEKQKPYKPGIARHQGGKTRQDALTYSATH
jgi:3-hydroxyisobutyrate dehydrogenase-like beta-hydroxyacid dehydrogenase